MKLRLAWTKTGDYFDIVATYPELAEWYVSACNRHDNKFHADHFAEDLQFLPCDNLIKLITQNISAVNNCLDKLRMKPIDCPDNFFDQTQLNQLHKNWIHIIQTYPKIEKLLHYFDPNLFDCFHAMNRQIHVLESSFRYTLRSSDSWREANPFPGKFFSPGIYNVVIAYTDHGRNSWEKFVNSEVNPNDHELSQWKNIGACISINLVKPYAQSFPIEFIDYCAQHNIDVAYNQLPLGNLANIEQLARARQMMNNNLTQNNNYLIITHI